MCTLEHSKKPLQRSASNDVPQQEGCNGILLQRVDRPTIIIWYTNAAILLNADCVQCASFTWRIKTPK